MAVKDVKARQSSSKLVKASRHVMLADEFCQELHDHYGRTPSGILGSVLNELVFVRLLQLELMHVDIARSLRPRTPGPAEYMIHMKALQVATHPT